MDDSYSNYSTQTYSDQDISAAAPIIAAFTGIYLLFLTVFIVLVVVSFWKIFTKAGKSGWAALIPFYNIYILLKVVLRPGWWLLLYFIPFVNFVIMIVVALDLAKVFGRSALFGFFLNFLFSPIGQLILGFGSSKYSPKK